MTRLILLTLTLFSWLAIAMPVSAQTATIDTLDYVQVTLIADVDRVTAGQSFTVKTHIKLADHWHTYAKDPGDSGIATSIEWTLPKGYSAGDIQWPKHQTFNEAGLTTYGYEGEVTLPVTLTPSGSITDAVLIKAKVSMLVCKDICVPQVANVSITLPVSGALASDLTEKKTLNLTDSRSGAADAGLPLILLFALLGGLILNLMPCVFPVLSLKALTLAKYGQNHPQQIRREAWAYTAGILTCFLGLAGLLIALTQSGAAIGWGYQFQSPAFVGIMAMLMLAIGLNLSGIFELPVLLGNAAANIQENEINPHKGVTLRSSFFTGLLAALVATPCTAPFMATAIGFSLAQPPAISLLVFAFLGLGLALPFLLLTYFPPLLKRLPKPGAWMVTFKELLAFPMYLTAIWLLWVLGHQTGTVGIIITLGMTMAIIFILWAKRPCKFNSTFCKIASWFIVAGLLVTTGEMLQAVGRDFTMPSHTKGANTLPYDAEKLGALREAGKPVFVNATAAWCITCQVNDKTTLSTDAIKELFKSNNITYMIADWTNEDPAITAFLEQHGHKGVPLYVYFPPKGEPVILPQILNPDVVRDVINLDIVR